MVALAIQFLFFVLKFIRTIDGFKTMSYEVVGFPVKSLRQSVITNFHIFEWLLCERGVDLFCVSLRLRIRLNDLNLKEAAFATMQQRAS